MGPDDLQQHFACVGNKRSLSAVVAISADLVFVRGLDDRMPPLLGDFFHSPTARKNVVKAQGERRVVDILPGGHLARTVS